MSSKTVRLIHGTLALVLLYVVGNVVYRSMTSKHDERNPQTLALIQQGQVIAESCAACHYLDQKTHFVGPHLVGVLGRPIASLEGYDYSPALQGSTGPWTANRLAAFLQNPQSVFPGTKMAIAGWSPEEVRAVVAFLESKE